MPHPNLQGARLLHFQTVAKLRAEATDRKKYEDAVHQIVAASNGRLSVHGARAVLEKSQKLSNFNKLNTDDA